MRHDPEATRRRTLQALSAVGAPGVLTGDTRTDPVRFGERYVPTNIAEMREKEFTNVVPEYGTEPLYLTPTEYRETVSARKAARRVQDIVDEAFDDTLIKVFTRSGASRSDKHVVVRYTTETRGDGVVDEPEYPVEDVRDQVPGSLTVTVTENGTRHTVTVPVRVVQETIEKLGHSEGDTCEHYSCEYRPVAFGMQGGSDGGCGTYAFWNKDSDDNRYLVSAAHVFDNNTGMEAYQPLANPDEIGQSYRIEDGMGEDIAYIALHDGIDAVQKPARDDCTTGPQYFINGISWDEVCTHEGDEDWTVWVQGASTQIQEAYVTSCSADGSKTFGIQLEDDDAEFMQGDSGGLLWKWYNSRWLQVIGFIHSGGDGDGDGYCTHWERVKELEP